MTDGNTDAKKALGTERCWPGHAQAVYFEPVPVDLDHERTDGSVSAHPFSAES